jgi:hypothetical protein
MELPDRMYFEAVLYGAQRASPGSTCPRTKALASDFAAMVDPMVGRKPS